MPQQQTQSSSARKPGESVYAPKAPPQPAKLHPQTSSVIALLSTIENNKLSGMPSSKNEPLKRQLVDEFGFERSAIGTLASMSLEGGRRQQLEKLVSEQLDVYVGQVH
jgi:hypothetical protein